MSENEIPNTTDDEPELNDADDAMLDITEVCEFWGGNKNPIDPSSLYRSIARGEHDPPIKFGNLSRWSRKRLIALRKRKLADALRKAARNEGGV
jgi:predicted DNA-binding transcriptional regulator AlpA